VIALLKSQQSKALIIRCAAVLLSLFGIAPGARAGEGLPLHAVEVFRIGSFQVTNSMIVVWIVALFIILFAQIATRNVRPIPSGAQNFWEWLVESLYGFFESILGPHLTKRTFWFFATLFILILAVNWFGLIPGVGSIGWGVPHEGESMHISRPILRGGNADLNMTLAMSIAFFIMWIYWAVTEVGVGGFLGHIFAPKGESKGFMLVLMIVVFFLVGILEVVSILFRPVSLSFRLFGNVFAGETMLETMSLLHPQLGWLIAIPFYFLELMVGLVQALVFTLLTAVFTLLICSHEEGEHTEGSGHAKTH
jgi:F-type H+-transporting ATPase subunit a